MHDIKPYAIFSMEITSQEGLFYHIKIKKGKSSCFITFNPFCKVLHFPQDNKLSNELKANAYQPKKILHNKRKETFYPGFKLKFIIRNNESAMAFNDLSRLVILDRRNGAFEVKSVEKDETHLLKIYTDGCYLEKKKSGAYISLFEKPNGLLSLFVSATTEKSSSLIELLAVIKGIEKAPGTEKLRIITDSRYVIKGITEWMFNWQLNNWHTAQGQKAKNIRHWKQFDQLTTNKYIEFEWVKAHSNHYYNSICDFYAKQAAEKAFSK
jgi:ribonuclease HI